MRRLAASALAAMALTHVVGNLVVDGEFAAAGLIVEIPLLVLALLVLRFGTWAAVLTAAIAVFLIVATGAATISRLSEPGQGPAILFAVLFMVGAAVTLVGCIRVIIDRKRRKPPAGGSRTQSSRRTRERK